MTNVSTGLRNRKKPASLERRKIVVITQVVKPEVVKPVAEVVEPVAGWSKKMQIFYAIFASVFIMLTQPSSEFFKISVPSVSPAAWVGMPAFDYPGIASSNKEIGLHAVPFYNESSIVRSNEHTINITRSSMVGLSTLQDRLLAQGIPVNVSNEYDKIFASTCKVNQPTINRKIVNDVALHFAAKYGNYSTGPDNLGMTHIYYYPYTEKAGGKVVALTFFAHLADERYQFFTGLELYRAFANIRDLCTACGDGMANNTCPEVHGTLLSTDRAIFGMVVGDTYSPSY